ncbi:MAG TPA: VgrG-related protein [Gemmatimonadaceae bacterium]|nr:VgrG-related protein [Gemmatimonadaceae bacterium]
MADSAALLSHFYLQIEGVGQPTIQELTDDLVSITVESSLHLPDVATLILHDTRLKWIDATALEPGKALRISAKASGAEGALFDGEIVELEPDFGAQTHRLIVRAFDRLHRLARGRHVRSFLNVSDGDLVQKVAREVGLQAKTGPTTEVHPYVFQNNETNLAFLRGRAASLGYLLFAEGKTLHFTEPSDNDAPIELQWATTLMEFRPRLTTIAQITESTVRGWDPSKRQVITGHVQNGNGAPAVGEQRKGGQLARTAFNLDAPHLTADRPVYSQAAADRLAQTMADRHTTRFIEAEGVCTGNTKIVAGVKVKVTAIGERFTGTYFVTSASHEYSPEHGYTTHFSVSGHHPATLSSILSPQDDRVPMRGLVIGIVTDNNDPEKQGRVKVQYPWLSADHASDWARVVVPGGGKERGMAFLPEINDEVLVGFELGDIHHPYVLGGLWNGQDAPPGDMSKMIAGSKVEQRVIRSRTGHTITLDDSDGDGGIRIEDRNGNVVHLKTNGDELAVTTKGNVSVESKANMNVKTQGNVTIEATGSLELKGMGVTIDGGGGTVDVKGSVINLN